MRPTLQAAKVDPRGVLRVHPLGSIEPARRDHVFWQNHLRHTVATPFSEKFSGVRVATQAADGTRSQVGMASYVSLPEQRLTLVDRHGAGYPLAALQHHWPLRLRCTRPLVASALILVYTDGLRCLIRGRAGDLGLEMVRAINLHLALLIRVTHRDEPEPDMLAHRLGRWVGVHHRQARLPDSVVGV